MIHFLKESKFVISNVFQQSLTILKHHYFSITGLCIAIFFTSAVSNILAVNLSDMNSVFSYFMAFFFIILFFGLNLTLFKYILKLIDHEGNIKLKETIPSMKEIVYFLGGMLIISLISLIIVILLFLVTLPFLYVFENGINTEILLENFTSYLFLAAALLTFLLIVRVSFYPFFIIDKHLSSYKSIKFSLALTKGNVMNLLMIMTVFFFAQLLQAYVNYLEYYYLFIFLNLLSSFLIVPLACIVFSVAYREMMVNFKNDQDPDVLDNIF